MSPIDETPGNYALKVDRGLATGNSLGPDDRLALHTKIKNNPDEPIEVIVVDGPLPDPEVTLNTLGEVAAVPQGVLTDILNYTVPAGKTFYLQLIELGGDNVALYSVYQDAAKIAVKRTWFAPGLNERLLFVQDLRRGLQIDSGSILKVQVIHTRPDPGTFDARAVGILVG